jgi:hypothetical protein
MDFNEGLLANFACLDPVYVDDAGGAVNLGTNFQLLFYRWQRVSNHGDQRDYETVPAVNLILPRTSVLARTGIIASWLQASTPPSIAMKDMARALAH